ncbi:MBL fold metallo-hydrolase [Leifsonia shinshuensis]|uniref:MBL fold metallo-hydrolase n=1 Tax=Leifsonia shinshuensis TaxID=150026 RepID=UPI002863B589|nr:MBL fold metallo-hydrolase [Leifsonia shinshuensis]MDR6972569.1 glyoxylase-like metal-dependent hydrolase (beta-lactamase superfamily II) [Leifsonia shinshuensis]
MTAFATLAGGVHAVRIPMPAGGLPFSLAYLIEDARGRLLVVDPGSPTAEAQAALMGAVDALGRRPADVAAIVLTHLHADHAGGAEELRRRTGAPVLLHRREQEALDALASGPPAPDLDAWGVPAERRPELQAAATAPVVPSLRRADGLLEDGDLLDVPGRRLRVLHTPGHTPGSVCLHDEDAGLVLSGDHVLPTVNTGLGLGGPSASNPIADYLASLRRVAALDGPDVQVLPGHEHPFTGLADRCAVLAEHHLRRAREVAAHPGGTVWEVAASLTWTGGWDALRGFTLLSALSQTALHRDFVARAPLP